MYFVKGLVNSILTYVRNMIHICPNSLGGGERASGSGDSTLRTSDDGKAVRRGHQKGILTEEVEVAENTNKDKIARHKKIRVIGLIPC